MYYVMARMQGPKGAYDGCVGVYMWCHTAQAKARTVGGYVKYRVR